MANKELSSEEIAVAIIESKTKKEAAEKLKITVRTLYDKLQSFEVQSVISVLRAEQLKARLNALEDSQEKAIKTICAIMESPESSAGDRLKAAAIILETGRAARAEIAAAEANAIGRLRNASREEQNRIGELWI